MPETLPKHRILELENDILAFVAKGNSSSTVLDRIIETLEAISGDVIGSILRLDRETCRLRVLSAPNLPDAYNQAIDGVEIGDGIGSCGTAAFRGKPVVVEDILNHPYWANFKGLASEHGLRACWSTPILSSDHEVLGTFAFYYKEPKLPSDREWELMSRLGNLASIAMEREANQHLLKEMAELDQAIVENTNDAILVITNDGQILKSNPKCRELFGFQESEFQALNFKDLVADQSFGSEAFRAKLIQRDPEVEIQQQFKSKSNQEFQAALNTTSLPNNRILLMIRDRRRGSPMENQCGPEERLQALTRMTLCVAEELKQSLTAIMSHRDLVAAHVSSSSELSGACEKPLNQILDAARHANAVTLQLNAFAPQSSFQLRSVDLSQLLGDLLVDLRSFLGPESTIDFRVGRGTTTVHTDPTQLKFAVQHVLIHLKSVDDLPQHIALSSHQGPGGEAVTISLELPSPSLTQTEHQSASTAPINGGSDSPETLLALNTVRGIVTQLNGHIELKQKSGHQVQLNLILPTAPTAAKPSNRTQAPDPHPPAAPVAEEILLCEDNEAIRLAVEGLLRASGYQVHTVKDGLEALEYSNRPDNSTALLISDIRMPGMSGKELSIKVREMHPNLQIILISGNTGGLVSPEWLASHNITFLAKPFTHSTLIGAVRDAFTTYRSMTT